MSGVDIRLANAGDIPMLAVLERAAGETFREIGMPEIADDDPLPEDVLAAGVADGRLWVAADAEASPVGYLLALRLGDVAHIEQVTVHPACARRGIGAHLIAACVAWTAEWDATSLTLTTFRDVPWNAPYYKRLGFRIVPGGEVPEPVRRIVEEERHAGLHRWPRVVMEYREDRAALGIVTDTGSR